MIVKHCIKNAEGGLMYSWLVAVVNNIMQRITNISCVNGLKYIVCMFMNQL